MRPLRECGAVSEGPGGGVKTLRTLAIGDIHGCLEPLDALLADIDIQPEDTLVTLGDYADRGPDSRGVLDRLLALRDQCHLVSLRGNHDQMMLDARQDARARFEWLQVGGDKTLASYGGSLRSVPSAHWDFLANQCVDLWETDTHFFVHGNVYPDASLWEQPRSVLYWERFDRTQPHQSGKIMICGHTSQKDGLPCNRGYAICIDTWPLGAWLSCLDVGSGVVWQADFEGARRQLQIADFLEPQDE